jgi:hypothetical protein
MKNFLLFFSFSIAVVLSGCKDTSSDVVINPNYCVPVAVNMNGSNFLKLSYDADRKKLESISISSEDGDILTSFKYDNTNKIISAESDLGLQTFTYSGNNITKVEVKEDGAVTGEKVITYSGNNIAKIEEFTIDGKDKTLSLAYTFVYDGDNVKKIGLKMTDLLAKEFPFFEGTTYNTNLGEYAGLANFKKVLFISNSDLFSILPSNFGANILSKNAVVSGKLSFSLFEILFGAIFGGISGEAEILKSLSLIDFKNSPKTNERGFVNSNSTVFGIGEDQNTLNTAVEYYCK